MLHPYPKDAPTAEAWQLLLKVWRGEPVDKIEALHTAWHAGGFVLAKFDPNHPPGPMPMTAAAHEDGARLLQSAADAASNVVTQPVSMQAFPWLSLLPVLLEIIKKLLER